MIYTNEGKKGPKKPRSSGVKYAVFTCMTHSFISTKNKKKILRKIRTTYKIFSRNSKGSSKKRPFFWLPGLLSGKQAKQNQSFTHTFVSIDKKKTSLIWINIKKEQKVRCHFAYISFGNFSNLETCMTTDTNL